MANTYELANKNVQTLPRQENELVLDQVSEANDKGSDSNDGNQARRFFSHGSVGLVTNTIEQKDTDFDAIYVKQELN